MRFWNIICHYLLSAVNDFLAGVLIPRAVASTLIVLIPKKLSVSTISVYKLINLCNFVHKMFTRLLTDRIKPVLGNLTGAISFFDGT